MSIRITSKRFIKTVCTCILVVLSVITGFSQQVYIFTNAAATGSAGPNSTQIGTAYLSTNLNGSVTVSGGIQQFTVPATRPYRIAVYGAQGYGQYGGRGATMVGDFTLTAGTVLKILVGQMGVLPSSNSYSNQWGGGGGSFVTYTNNVPLVVAGGGGGSHASSFQSSADGTTSINGNTGTNGSPVGSGGTSGGGGGTGNSADGGGGFNGNGSGTAGGASYTLSGLGGALTGQGGFGGGGGSSSYNDTRGGGGGGYSGGGGSYNISGTPSGGGGGSYNGGVNQLNTSGSNSGQGKVVITELCNIGITVSGATNSVNPVICTGQSLTLTSDAVSSYSWSTGVTGTNQIIVSPTANTVITAYGTTTLGCPGQGSVAIIVSPGLPSLSLSVSSNSVCLGDSVTISASGAMTYTYSSGISPGVKFVPTQNTTYTVSGTNGCGTSSTVATITVTPLSISASTSSSLICANGIITLSVSGAQSYTWYPGGFPGGTINAIPVSNTNYTVVGRSGACYAQSTVQVNTLPSPTLSVVGTESNICAGEVVTITVGGASTYTWVNLSLTTTVVTVNPNTHTEFTVQGTAANGCTATSQYLVLSWPAPTVNAIVSPSTICIGATATLQASGANTYSWAHGPTSANTTVTPVSSSTFYVVGTESTHGCTATVSVPIDVYQATISVSPNASVCPGSTTLITSGPANTYTWSNGNNSQFSSVSPSATTVYTINATALIDNMSCICTNTVEVFLYSLPSVTASANQGTICTGENATLTASGALSYSWTSGVTQSMVVHYGNSAGTYTYGVIGTDQNNCKNTQTVTVIVSGCNGLGEFSSGNKISVYPNPSNGAFVIIVSEGSGVELYNELGQKFRQYDASGAADGKIFVQDLPKGVYTVKVSSTMVKVIVD